jgi:zinc protease
VFHAVYYKAGTADDPGGAIGAAGFLPTLLLKSTEKIATGNHAEASKHLWQLQGMAFSGFTLFRHSVARDQLQGAMQAQADRMTQLHLSDEEIKATRQAMLDLFSRRERTPGSLFNERMEAEQHGRAVGSSNEPGELTRAAAVAFQERYYGPNNAVLALSGDVTLEDAKRLAEDTYGKIASRPEVARRTPIREPLHSGARRVMVKDPGARETNFKRYYTVPGYGGAMSGEAEALEVLMKIVLGRLNQRLVDTKIASKVNSEYVKIRDPGIFTLYVATDSERHEAAEAEVDAVIDEIRTIGITEAELDRARQALARAFADEKGAHTALVGRYVTALAFGRTMAQIDEGPEVLAKLTVDDIKKVAATYLDPSRSVTGWLLKAEATGDVAAA